jgi:hypothetical protein
MIPALLFSGLAVCEASRLSVLEAQLSMDLGGGSVIRVDDGSRCLDVYGENIHADKVTIYAARCNGDKGQMWRHEHGALHNVASGRCLDIEGASTSNGANLILFRCNGQKNQQFQFNKGTNSIYQPKSGKCLDVDMKSSIKNVLLWTCKDSQNQKMDWAAEWSLSQASETLKVDNGVSTDETVSEEVGSYPKRGDTVKIEWTDSKDFTKAPGEMCSAADRKILFQEGWKGKPDDSKHGGFPAAMDACGRAGYSFWHNTFTLKDFETCVKESAYRQLSKDCVKCISIGPAYGALNCKSACATNACSSNCVACNQASGAYIHKCSGGGTATSYCPKGWAKHPPAGCNDPKKAINDDGSINPLPEHCASGNE